MKKINLNTIFDKLFPICRGIAGDGYNYSLNILKEYINFKILKYQSGKKVFETSLAESSNYKTSSTYIDTLNREKKIVDNLIKNLANQVNYKLNLIFKEK